MSQLEDRVKPIVEGLFDEESVVLDSSAQMALAAWAGKNAMVYEVLRSEASWFFTNLERKAMRESLQLPPVSSVWIAKCVEHAGVYCKASDLGGFAEVSKDQVKTYVTTMSFGPLAIQVISSKVPSSISSGTDVMANVRLGPWSQVTLQIWPIQSEQITWPASMGLSSEFGLETFSERWSPAKS